jgi:PAT family beta-lactamase induction signal transducer AmpG
VRMETLGWMAAALVAVPAMAALAAPFQSSPSLPSPSQPSPSQPEPGSGRARATAARVWSEFRATFLRRDAIPYALLITFPMCSGAMLGLLPELARDYGVSGAQVAWMNGLGGALLTAAGALCASLTPLRVRAPIAFLLAGLVNAATLALLALAPLRPEVYFAGTVLFLFTIGACYAYFTGVALEFLGPSGKSGSGRYAIINSLGNLPVAYMSWIDGRGYARWGPRAMPGIDAAVSAAGAVVLLTWFVLERRNRFRPAR